MKNTRIYTYFLFLLLFLGNVSASQQSKIPTSLEEAIKTSDLIVTGKLGEIKSTKKFYGYQKNAGSLAKFDKLSSLPLALVAVDYKIEVDTVIYNKNNTRETNNLTFRVIQSQFAKPEKSDNSRKTVFFLSKTSAGEKNYSTKTILHKLQLNGEDPVSYSLGKKQVTLNRANNSRANNNKNLSSYDFLSKVIELSAVVKEQSETIKTEFK